MTPALLYFLALPLTYAGIILFSPHPPELQDYPTWVYEGLAVSHAIAGHPDPHFAIKHFPVPNLLSDAGLGLLCLIMSWQLAAKIWLCFYLAFATAAFLGYWKSLPEPAPSAYWLAPTIAVVNLCFWWGFINFQFSLALMVIFCSALRRQRPNEWIIGILLVLVFLAHAVSFAVCLLALAIYAVTARSYRLLLSAIPAVLLAGWYIYGRFVMSGDPEGLILKDPEVPYFSKAFIFYKANTYFKSLGYVNPTRGHTPIAITLAGAPAIYVLLAVTALLGVALGYVIYRSGWVTAGKQNSARALRLTVLAATLAAIFSPSQAFGLSDPGSRFMVCALTLAVILLRPKGKAYVIACTASVFLGVTGILLFASLSLQRPGDGVSGRPLPHLLAQFAHVEPETRDYFYNSMMKQQTDQSVFGTALLLNKQTHADTTQPSSK